MKTIILFAIFMATMTFISCSESNNDVLNSSELPLIVQADFGEFATRATISSFPNQAELGLFVTSGALGNHYNNISSNANVRAVYNSSSRIWTKTPEVYLSPANATIFAYYPYSVSNNDGKSIPVEHISQVDYLFGSHSAGQSVVNNGNSTVNLTMKHALALLQFKINRVNYTGPGVVTRIEVANATGKTSLYSNGTLNIATGSITNMSNQNSSAVIQNGAGLYTIPASASSAEDPRLRLMVLPVNGTTATGDIKMYFTIDNKEYTYNVPVSTNWKQGTKNTYTITLSGTELIVGNISITDWTSGISGNATLQ